MSDPNVVSQITLKNLYTYLCDDYSVSTSVEYFGRQDGATYFSYFNLLNPLPCLDIIYANFYWHLISKGHTLSSVPEPWLPWETYSECTTSFTGTLDAYIGAWTGGVLPKETFEPFRNFGTSTMQEKKDMGMRAATWYANFGLSWVHYSYPNYKMSCPHNGHLNPRDSAKVKYAEGEWDEIMDGLYDSVPDYVSAAMDKRWMGNEDGDGAVDLFKAEFFSK